MANYLSSSGITDNQFKAWLNDLRRIAPDIAKSFSEADLRSFCEHDYGSGAYTSNDPSERWANAYSQANDHFRNSSGKVSPEEAYVQDRIGYTSNKQVAPYSSTKQLQTTAPKDIRAYTPNYTQGIAPDYIDAKWSEVTDKPRLPEPPKSPTHAINAGNASRFLGVSVPVVQSWASGLGAAYGAPEDKGGNFFSRGFEGGIKDTVRDAIIGVANLTPTSALINYATDDSINKAITNAIPETTNMKEKGYLETAGDWIGYKLYDLFMPDAQASTTKSSFPGDLDLDAPWAATVDASRAIDPTAAARSYSANNSNYPTQAKQDAQNYIRSVTGSDTNTNTNTNTGSSSLSKSTNASNRVATGTSNVVATANNARPSAQVTPSYDAPTTVNVNGTSYDVRDMEKFHAMMDNPSIPYGAREEASYIWNALKAQRDARYSNWRR